jgi:hypothetical protein
LLWIYLASLKIASNIRTRVSWLQTS